MSTESNVQSKIETIRSRVQSFRQSQIYIAFAELGIGHALTDTTLMIDDLAAATGSDVAALTRFLEAAQAFDLVDEHQDGLYALTPLGHALYSPNSEQALNNALKLEGAFYRRWGRLTEGVQLEGRPEANRAQEDDPGWVRMFTMALYENSRIATRTVAQTISSLLPAESVRRTSILDLGGGHGGYSIALAHARDDINATVFDLPSVIEVTKEIIASHKLEQRVSSVAGNFHIDPIGSEYDAVLLFGVLHGESSDNAVKLLETIRQALKPGGTLLIRSRGSTREAPQSGERELFDLHMLLSTEGGQVQRATDTRALVETHGFKLDDELEIEPRGSGQILVFRPDES